MNDRQRKNDRAVNQQEGGTFAGRWMLALAAALVVVLALTIGLNVGGLREELVWRISPPRIQSLAVLPFENLSRDPAQDAFTDGFSAGVTDKLTDSSNRIRTFRVIARTSVTQYKKAPKPTPEIGQELNADAVVQGSVLRSGDHIRLTAILLHAPTNRRLWGQTYEQELRDVVNLQGEVSRAVMLAIGAKLTPQEEARLTARRTVNPQAYDSYAQGAYGGNPAKREAYMMQAIQLDPAFPDPFNSLSSLLWMRNMFPTLAPKDTYPKAKDLAQKAISLDPEHQLVSQAHRILALVDLEYDWDFVEAEREFKLAVEAAPSGVNAHHYYAHYLLSMGRLDEAKAESQRAIEIMPKSSSLLACVSWHDITERNYEEAEKRSLQALRLGAPDQLARLTLGWSYALRGRHDEAIAEFQKAVVGWKGAVFPTAVLGHGYAVAGKTDAAREVLDKLLARSKTEYVSPYEIAVVYAGLGDRDRAFEWLEKAYAEHASLLVYFRMDPRIWGLRSDPRFQDLLRRMNFPQER